MTASTNRPEAFPFMLLRPCILDANGTPVEDNCNDPRVWAMCDALSDAGAPTVYWPVGKGEILILDGDCLAFVHTHIDADAEGSFVKAELLMEGSDTEVGMGNVVAVILSDGSAICYSVMFTGFTPDPKADWFIDLPAEQAVLELRDDVGLLTPAAEMN